MNWGGEGSTPTPRQFQALGGQTDGQTDSVQRLMRPHAGWAT